MTNEWHHNAVINRRQIQVPWGLLWYVTNKRTVLYKHDIRYALWFGRSWEHKPDREFAVSALYDRYGNPANRFSGRWYIDESNRWANAGNTIFVKTWQDVQLCLLHHFLAEAA